VSKALPPLCALHVHRAAAGAGAATRAAASFLRPRFSRACRTRAALVRKRARGALQVFGEFGCNGIWPKRPCRIRHLGDGMAASWRRVAKAQRCGGTRFAERRRILFGEVVRAQSSVPKYGSTATPRSHGSVSTTARAGSSEARCEVGMQAMTHK
jgi:hypothetical protein